MAENNKISSTVGKSDHGPVGKLLLPKSIGSFPVGKSVSTKKCGSWGFGLLSYSTALYNIPCICPVPAVTSGESDPKPKISTQSKAKKREKIFWPLNLVQFTLKNNLLEINK